MNIESFIGVACAAVAIATAMPAAAQVGETVTLHFEQAIPNIPGKSLVAQFVDYAPRSVASARPRKIGFHLRVRSVWEKSSHRSMTNLSGSTVRAKVGTRRRAPSIASAAMQARPRRQSCSRSLSSTPTTKTT